jgi:hypothetical protein
LHGAILLKAIRTTYNIFLLSKSNDVQIIAQGTVLQMVQNVLGRIPIKKSDSATTPIVEGYISFQRKFFFNLIFLEIMIENLKTHSKYLERYVY